MASDDTDASDARIEIAAEHLDFTDDADGDREGARQARGIHLPRMKPIPAICTFEEPVEEDREDGEVEGMHVDTMSVMPDWLQFGTTTFAGPGLGPLPVSRFNRGTGDGDKGEDGLSPRTNSSQQASHPIGLAVRRASPSGAHQQHASITRAVCVDRHSALGLRPHAQLSFVPCEGCGLGLACALACDTCLTAVDASVWSSAVLPCTGEGVSG